MKYFLFILFQLTQLLPVASQKNSYKVDSVFNFYFSIFDMEINDSFPHKRFPEYYYFIVIKESNDSVYLNKYISKAATFIQEISGIKSMLSSYENSGPIKYTVNPEIVEEWRKWYSSNRHCIVWNKKKKKPVLKSICR